MLYGPLDYKNKVTLQYTKIERERVHLSLRKIADYRFLFYFLVTFLVIKFIFSLSYINNFFVLFLIFCCYIFVKALVM